MLDEAKEIIIEMEEIELGITKKIKISIYLYNILTDDYKDIIQYDKKKKVIQMNIWKLLKESFLKNYILKIGIFIMKKMKMMILWILITLARGKELQN